MENRIVSLLVSLIFSSVIVASAAVTGRVVDGTGKPVFDAMVMYVKADNHLIYTYSDVNGRFTLPGPSEWSLKTITDSVSARQPALRHEANVKQGAFNLSASGNSIYFTIATPQTISISLYALSGKRIAAVTTEKVVPGFYQVNPFSALRQPVAQQGYIVRLSNGTAGEARKIMFHGNDHAMPGARDNAITTAPLLKTAAVIVDSVRAGKTNFRAAYKSITAYAGDLGDFAIQARDIEAEITTIMNGKTTQWKGYQVTQGIAYSTSPNWGTIFYGVGNYGGAAPASYLKNADQSDLWQNATVAAVGTPKMIGIDAVHGFISPPSGTVFPHNIGMGCSQNRRLVELEERVTACELRAMGINWAFAPCIDIPRNEHWGRTYEGWDEGPAGTVPFARAAIRGFQGTDLSAYCVASVGCKHYAGSGGTTAGQNAGNCATGTDAVLCKIHLPPFRAAVEEGAGTIMISMCDWLGTPLHNYPRLINDTLKTGWKFDGFTVGDWQYSANVGLANSFNAGVDNMMNPNNPNDAYNAVVSTAVPAARLDDACKRILRVKLRMDLPAKPLARRELLPYVAGPLHKSVARECVRRSMVLLKNDNKALPLNPNAKIHIVGSFADDMWMQCGGWIMDWPSGYYDTPRPNPPAGQTLRAAIQAVCPNATYSATAATIPADAAAIVVCVGELPYAESGGDAPGNQPFTLTSAHKTLISQCAASNIPVIVVMYSGRPLVITDDIALSKAWLQAWLPGTEGGGIADILFNVNGEKPTGKLSFTWPAAEAQVPVNYNDPSTNQPYGDATGTAGAPLFPYHWGLTYQ
jgi:beta-glucosidase